MNILYIINSYNPEDKNDNYFNPDGYIFRNISLVSNMISNSKHNVDFVVSGFSWGPKTVESMLKYRKDNNIKCSYIVGPDVSSHIAVNKSIFEAGKSKDYDIIFHSTSDTLPKKADFDEAMDDFAREDKCDILQVQCEPGFAYPGRTLKDSYWDNIPMGEGVTQDVYAVKSKYLKAYDGRFYTDIFESSSTEVYFGYMCHAQGGYRKVTKHLYYDHLRKHSTDRKTSHPQKMRGGKHLLASVFLRRDLSKIMAEGNECGCIFDMSPGRGGHPIGLPLNHDGTDKYNVLPENKRERMYKFIKENLFLSSRELNYNKIRIKAY